VQPDTRSSFAITVSDERRLGPVLAPGLGTAVAVIVAGFWVACQIRGEA